MRYIFFLFFLSSSLIAQEVLTPLKSNPREKKSDFLKNKSSLSLPFFDDFSSLNISSNLWIGNSTFINNNYPMNMIWHNNVFINFYIISYIILYFFIRDINFQFFVI